MSRTAVASRAAEDSRYEDGRVDVIVAANRAPWVAAPGGRPKLAPGGLVRAVHPALRRSDRWVALAPDGQRDAPRAASPSNACGVRFVDADSECRGLARTASNRVLWFALHGMDVDRELLHRHADWFWERGQRALGLRFAIAIADEWRRRPAPVLLQDYHLFSCPAALRALVPEAPIAFFVHTPFLGTRTLAKLPLFAASDVLRSLLACDLVGFQARRDADAFAQACQVFLGARATDGAVEWARRTVRLGVFPACADANAIRDEAARVAGQGGGGDDDGSVTVVWAGRADPVKNPLRAIEAFGRLLAEEPSLAGRARLVLKTQETRDEPEYEQCRLGIYEAVAKLDAEIARDGWVPVVVDPSPQRDRAVAALRSADVLLVNSVADGMNLVVQEGVLIGSREPVVVLSRTAGAFERLGHDVVSVDPMSVDDTVRALRAAIEMPVDERRRRFTQLRAIIESASPESWLRSQLAALGRAVGERFTREGLAYVGANEA